MVQYQHRNHANHHHTSSSKFNAAFSTQSWISFIRTASNETSHVTTEQVKLWLIAEMNTIPLFFRPYDMFSGKFQSAHFVFFRNVRLRRSYSTVQIHFIKSPRNSVPWYFNPKVSITSIRDSGFFNLLPIHLSSLAVVFLGLPGGFLSSHDPVSSSFLKILWIILLDIFTVFEISPIESLPSLRNLTISCNHVRFFSAIFTMQEPGESWCNLLNTLLYILSLKYFHNTK